MKQRNGFVSNSSSSSFVCAVCRRTESGWDMSPYDFDMVQCENDHVICQDELLFDDDSLTEKEQEEIDEGDGTYPERFCPVCSFIIFSDGELANYLEKTYKIPRLEVLGATQEKCKQRRSIYDCEYNMYVLLKLNRNREDIMNEVRSKYKTYAEFLKYLRRR